jgi:hypothetical protein
VLSKAAKAGEDAFCQDWFSWVIMSSFDWGRLAVAARLITARLRQGIELKNNHNTKGIVAAAI